MAYRFQEGRSIGLFTGAMLVFAWGFITFGVSSALGGATGSSSVANLTFLILLVGLPAGFIWLRKKREASEQEAGTTTLASARSTITLSHWNTMIEGLAESPQSFYTQLEESLEKRSLSDITVSRVVSKEGSILSANREYLQVRRKELVFHICGAPFGNGFFVSEWLGETQGFFTALLSQFPFANLLFAGILRPLTYYRVDTANMFNSLVHFSVLEVVDGLVEAKGLRALAQDERKPIRTDFFER